MSDSAIFRTEFFLLVIASLLIPVIIYGILMAKRRMSRITILSFGVVLIILSGIDIVLLQLLMSAAKKTPSVWDDKVFTTEFSMALYLLPLVSASIGTNVISHILVAHLADAESLRRSKDG